MTVAVPNYFLTHKPNDIITVTDGLWVKRASSYTGTFEVRNTVHGMLVLLEGDKRLQMESDHLLLQACEAAVFPQGNYFMSQNSQAYRAVAVYFDDSYAKRMLQLFNIQEPDKKSESFVFRYRFGVESSLFLTTEAIWKMFEKPEYTMQIKKVLELRIQTLFGELFAADPVRSSHFFYTLIFGSAGRFGKILEDNLDILERVEDMHSLLRMSPSHFNRRFKECFGINPKEWLQRKRLQKAAMLLRSSKMPIREVAAECHFATVSWFIYVFKRYYRTTPLSYRNENRHF